MKVKSLSHVRLFVTPWTAACQAPLPVGFSRQEYWSGVPFPSPRKILNSTVKMKSQTCRSPSSVDLARAALSSLVAEVKRET